MQDPLTDRKFLSTAEAAEALRARPSTLRYYLCRRGNYCGVRPVKLPSGRLLWPAGDIKRLLTDGS